MPSGAFVPYTVQVFASTEAGRGNPVTSVVYTRHGGKSIAIMFLDFCIFVLVATYVFVFVFVCLK